MPILCENTVTTNSSFDNPNEVSLIRFVCSSCWAVLEVPSSLGGVKGPCPKCSAEIQAPLPRRFAPESSEGEVDWSSPPAAPLVEASSVDLPKPCSARKQQQAPSANLPIVRVSTEVQEPVVPVRRNSQRHPEPASRRGILISMLIATILLAAAGGVAIGWAVKDRFTSLPETEGWMGGTGLIDTEEIREERLAEREGVSVILDALNVLDQFFAASDEAEFKSLLLSYGDEYPLIDSLIALHSSQAITGEGSDLMVFHTGWARVGGEIVEEIRFGGPLATMGGTHIVKVYLYKVGKSWKVDGYVYEQSITNRLSLFLESAESDQSHMLTVELTRKHDEYNRIEARSPGGRDVLFSFESLPQSPGFNEFRKVEATGKVLKNLRVKRASGGVIKLADDPIISEIAYWSGGAG